MTATCEGGPFHGMRVSAQALAPERRFPIILDVEWAPTRTVAVYQLRGRHYRYVDTVTVAKKRRRPGKSSWFKKGYVAD